MKRILSILLFAICYPTNITHSYYNPEIYLAPDYAHNKNISNNSAHNTGNSFYGMFAQEHTQFNNLARQRMHNQHVCRHQSGQHPSESPDAARTARIHAREKSLQKSMNGKSVTRSYHLSNSAETLLIDNKQNPLFLSECIGTKFQQQLHKELVDIVNHTAELSMHPAIGRSPIPVGTIINLAQVSSEFNQQGEVVKGFAVADLSWAMLDFSKAVLEGVALGGKMVANDLWDHPIEATATIVAGEFVLMYQLAKVLHEVADISVKGMIRNIDMMQDPQKGVDQWVEFLKPIVQIVDELSKKELSLRDGVKGTTALIVGWKTQSKLFGVLNKFYSGTKTRVVEFARKNPMATPEQYATTPEGMVFRAASDASKKRNIELPRNASNHNKGKAGINAISIPKTKQQILDASIKLGFYKTNYYSHGQPVFQKGNKFITPDVDSHCGGFWKMANSVENLASKRTRMGTYDEFLNRIGD